MIGDGSFGPLAEGRGSPRGLGCGMGWSVGERPSSSGGYHLREPVGLASLALPVSLPFRAGLDTPEAFDELDPFLWGQHAEGRGQGVRGHGVTGDHRGTLVVLQGPTRPRIQYV